LAAKKAKAVKSKAKSGSPQNMEELLAMSSSPLKAFHQGEVVQAKISSITPRSIVLSIGGKSEGIVDDSCFEEIKSFAKHLKVGDTVQALVIDPETPDGYVKLSLRHFVANAIWHELQEAKSHQSEIEVLCKNVTENGIVVELYGNLIGFIPISQIGKAALKNLDSLANARFKVKVIEVDRSKNRIVLSERAVSEKADIEAYTKALESLKEGEVYEGVVAQVTSFGAFVSIQVKSKNKVIPIEGLVHVSELSWEKVDDTTSAISEGEAVKVKVIEVRDGKLSLSIKQAETDPWSAIEDKYSPEQRVTGVVTRKSSFGTFVALEPGIEGLIHMTKIPPGTELKKGQEVSCYIEDISKDEKRISLGLVLTAKPVGYK